MHLRRTDSDSRRSRETETAATPRRRRVVEGAEGGLVATLVMTAYRIPIAHSLPPTALFWSKFVAGGDPEDHLLPALALHLLYGVGAGALFGGLFPNRGPEDDAERESLGLLWGVGYGLTLSMFGERVVLNRVLDVDLDADEALVFHVGHLVYALTLGTWLGSRTDDEQ